MFSERIEKAINEAISRYKKEYTVTADDAPFIIVQSERHTTKQKLGRFLSVLDNAALVKELVDEYKELGSDISDYKVSFSAEYEEIYKYPLYALDSTNRSCMTNMECVKVYAGDKNLKLLLIHKGELLVGRTLVREDKKQYIRLYIDHNYIKDFVARAIVTKYGYVKGDLLNIRLPKIEDSQNYLMPYLDGKAFSVVDEGDHFRIGYRGEYSAISTTGYLQARCSGCGAVAPESDLIYIASHDSQICASCFNDDYTYYNGDIYRQDSCVMNESTGELVPETVAWDMLTCVSNGDWYYTDDTVCTVTGEYEPRIDCEELVLMYDYEWFALRSEVIYVQNREGFKDGYYLQEQIDSIEAELEEGKEEALEKLL